MSVSISPFGTGSTQAGNTNAGLTPVGNFITQRDPLATDDTNEGFVIGGFWINTRTQKVWQASSVSAGAAVWGAVTVTGLPLDIAPVGAGGCAFATYLLTTGYAGACMNVQRADNATQDIGFVNGAFDIAGLISFLSGQAGSVAIWYDQSGNGNHATQATQSAQPVIYIDYRYGRFGPPTLSFTVNGYSGSTVRTMSIASTLVFVGNNLAIGLYFREHIFNSNQTIFRGLGTTPGQFLVTSVWDTSGGFSGTTGSGAIGARMSHRAQAIMLNRGTGAGLPGNVGGMWVNGIFTSHGFAVNANTFAGGTISPVSISGDMSGLIVWPANIATAAAQSAHLSMMLNANIAPQSHGQLFCDGDSLTYGFNSETTQNYPYRLGQILNTQLEIRQIGTPGITAATLATNYPTAAAPFFNSSLKNNVLIIWAGTNDLQTGATPAAAYTSLSSYISQAQATGWKVITLTMLPRITVETNRLAFNILVLGNVAGADAVVDITTDPRIGDPNAPLNKTYYPDDDVHIGGPGMDILIGIVAPAVNALLVP